MKERDPFKVYFLCSHTYWASGGGIANTFYYLEGDDWTANQMEATSYPTKAEAEKALLWLVATDPNFMGIVSVVEGTMVRFKVEVVEEKEDDSDVSAT